DFIVSERQLDLAAALGADAVLLIARALTADDLAGLTAGARPPGVPPGAPGPRAKGNPRAAPGGAGVPRAHPPPPPPPPTPPSRPLQPICPPSRSSPPRSLPARCAWRRAGFDHAMTLFGSDPPASKRFSSANRFSAPRIRRNCFAI